jgi:hypothetical protein
VDNNSILNSPGFVLYSGSHLQGDSEKIYESEDSIDSEHQVEDLKGLNLSETGVQIPNETVEFEVHLSSNLAGLVQDDLDLIREEDGEDEDSLAPSSDDNLPTILAHNHNEDSLSYYAEKYAQAYAGKTDGFIKHLQKKLHLQKV